MGRPESERFTSKQTALQNATTADVSVYEHHKGGNSMLAVLWLVGHGTSLGIKIIITGHESPRW